MTVRTWAWLIGMSGEPDARLVERAKSFANPPALELRGARVGFDGYVPERRAIQLVAEGPEVAITIKPAAPCVNPVFEIRRCPGRRGPRRPGRPAARTHRATPGTGGRSGSRPRSPTPTELRVGFGARR